MTINIPNSTLKVMSISLAGIAILIGFIGSVYAMNHNRKVDFGAASVNEDQGSSDVQANTPSSDGQPSTTPATTPSQVSSSATQPTNTYQSTVTTKLTSDAESKYENCWSLFAQYDSSLAGGNYDDATIYSNLSITGVGGLSGGISVSGIEGYSSYSDTLTKAIGGIWTSASNALDNYHQAAVYLSTDPGNQTSDFTQKGNQYLATARGQLSQAKAAYEALPK
jgi:hypothetical protein